jgi:hypothetical protein
MKVKDLIEALQKHDPELMVVRSGYEGGVSEVTSTEEIKIALKVHPEWYYGDHEAVDEDEGHKYRGHERVQAIYVD